MKKIISKSKIDTGKNIEKLRKDVQTMNAQHRKVMNSIKQIEIHEIKISTETILIKVNQCEDITGRSRRQGSGQQPSYEGLLKVAKDNEKNQSNSCQTRERRLTKDQLELMKNQKTE